MFMVVLLNDIHDESRPDPFWKLTEYVMASPSASVKLLSLYVPVVSSVALIAGKPPAYRGASLLIIVKFNLS